MGREVYGRTLGIIGLGRIGSAVAKRARGFDMTVIHSSTNPNSSNPGVPLTELLSTSDFVSLHCPLTEETHHLIDASALATMKPTAILINTARGPIVDQPALADALNGSSIAGAAVDVTDPEPPPADDPILAAPNLVITPHIGSATQAARERMADSRSTTCSQRSKANRCPTRSTRSTEVRVAVVDIGTNSTRLLIAERRDGRIVDELFRRSTVTRLGAGVDVHNRLAPEAIERTFKTLDEYAVVIQDHDPDQRSPYSRARSATPPTAASSPSRSRTATTSAPHPDRRAGSPAYVPRRHERTRP